MVAQHQRWLYQFTQSNSILTVINTNASPYGSWVAYWTIPSDIHQYRRHG